MGRIVLGVLPKLEPHPNQAKHYGHDVSEELCKHHVRSIARSWVDDKQCYVLGMGGCPAELHKRMGMLAGVDLIWSGSGLPFPWRILSCLVASHAGLYRLSSAENLEVLFGFLTESAMAGIYFIAQDLAPSFEQAVIRTRGIGDYEPSLYEDAGYFSYEVDGDNYESKTGLYEIVSIGRNSSFLETNF